MPRVHDRDKEYGQVSLPPGISGRDRLFPPQHPRPAGSPRLARGPASFTQARTTAMATAPSATGGGYCGYSDPARPAGSPRLARGPVSFTQARTTAMATAPSATRKTMAQR